MAKEKKQSLVDFRGNPLLPGGLHLRWAARRIVLGLLAGTPLALSPALAEGKEQYKIAFQSSRDGKQQIYIMNADGAKQKRLTKNSAFDACPSWSPDGKKIAFQSDRDGDNDIYVMNADGTGQLALTDNSDSDGCPYWSPDGKKIAFSSTRAKDSDIYVMNADGTGERRLTHSPGDDYSPSWSPDSRKLVFGSSRRSIQGGMHTIDADGTNESANLLTKYSPDILPPYIMPSWSPDGKKIAFKAYLTKGRSRSVELFVMNADGSGLANLTGSRLSVYCYEWSPDGKKIAFTHAVPGKESGLSIMNPDGSNVEMVTDQAGVGFPRWSPDGKRILFSRDLDVFIINRDGTGFRELTYKGGSNTRAAWSPVPIK